MENHLRNNKYLNAGLSKKAKYLKVRKIEESQLSEGVDTPLKRRPRVLSPPQWWRTRGSTDAQGVVIEVPRPVCL